MLGYLTLGVSDLDRATEFYTSLLADRDVKIRIDNGRMRFLGIKGEKTMIALCRPYDGEPYTVGNGTMLSFACASKEAVDAMHAKALSLGATDDGQPGQRIPDRFYGAYARDPDGHKLCFYIFG